jgi:hypothetical protein
MAFPTESASFETPHTRSVTVFLIVLDGVDTPIRRRVIVVVGPAGPLGWRQRPTMVATMRRRRRRFALVVGWWRLVRIAVVVVAAVVAAAARRVAVRFKAGSI